MSETLEPAGCGFLSQKEIGEALEGRLPEERRNELELHVEQGCAECVTLVVDLEVFRGVLADGVSEMEARESDLQAEILAGRLREGTEARGADRTWSGGLVAAAVVVLAVLGWMVLRERKPAGLLIPLPDGSTYVAEPRPFNAPPVLRGAQDQAALWRAAGSAYQRENYASASASFDEILEREPSSFDAWLYRAVCLLALERVEDARAALAAARLIAEEQDLSLTSLVWFEGLAALAANDSDAARRALRQAADGKGPYAEDARKLLDRVVE